MSIHCPNRAWQHTNQKGAALLLLLALAHHAGHDGFARIGIQALARKTRLSGRHVSRLVLGLSHPGRRLQAAGELLVLPHPGPGLLDLLLDRLSSSTPDRLSTAQPAPKPIPEPVPAAVHRPSSAVRRPTSVVDHVPSRTHHEKQVKQ